MPKTLSDELTLGQRLARARREAKLNQQQLAEKLGVSRQTISNYERDEVEETRFDFIAKWGAATDVSLDYFARGVSHPSDCEDGSMAPVFVLHGECKGQTVLPFAAAALHVVADRPAARPPFRQAA